MRIKKTTGEKVFDVLNHIFLFLAAFVALYPFIYVFSMSISDPAAVVALKVFLWPVGFATRSYEILLRNPNVLTSYYNTIWYTVVGTLLNILVTVTYAYPLSRKDFFARGFFMVLLAVTMFFGGGIIPSFLLIQKLGLYNTRWAIILPAAMTAWNVIMTRVFFQSSIPESLGDSGKIDGCSDIGILFRIVLPLSLPIVSVVALFSAVGFWNSYFTAMIYLPNAKLQPLQIYLMKILVQNMPDLSEPFQSPVTRDMYAVQLKYAVIMVSIIPIICAYPFLQRYFVKGVMVGAIKE